MFRAPDSEREVLMANGTDNKGKSLLLKIKEFFEYPTLAEFRADWEKLSDDEKEWFKQEIAKITE